MAGYFSAHLGIGGALVTAPAIRLIFLEPAFIAVGTPLVVNIPTAFVGASSYYRRGFVATRLVAPLALSGMIGAIGGASLTRFVSGDIILLTTSVVIFTLSMRFLFSRQKTERTPAEISYPTLAVSGLGIGFVSGFLGLGGGFLLVPFLTLVGGLDMKTTFGTSLAVVAPIAIPGAVVHFLLGHVDLSLAALLIIGVIPGAYVGARMAMRLSNLWLKMMFGVLLGAVAVYLGVFEVLKLVS